MMVAAKRENELPSYTLLFLPPKHIYVYALRDVVTAAAASEQKRRRRRSLALMLR